MLLKSGKPVVLCVNKMRHDRRRLRRNFMSSTTWVWAIPFAVSSVHGHGTGDLLDAVLRAHRPREPRKRMTRSTSRLRSSASPTWARSSLVNRMAGEERVIVSDIAGTTRDAIDTDRGKRARQICAFIDTAGIRRKSRVDGRHRAVQRPAGLYGSGPGGRLPSLCIDATEGFTEQDSKVAGYAHEQGKACIVAVNKWDAVEKDGKTMEEYRKKLEDGFLLHELRPVHLYLGAKTGQRVGQALRADQRLFTSTTARAHFHRYAQRSAGLCHRPGPASFGQGQDGCKIYYMTQASTKPPTFVVFCNRTGSVPLLLPAVSGKPDPGDLRSGRYPDPHHSPGAGQGQQVIQAVRKEG